MKCIVLFLLVAIQLLLLLEPVSSAPVAAIPNRRGGSSSQNHQHHQTTTPLKVTTFRKAFVRGGASRAIGQAILYPVDALRTLAQTRDGKTLADVGTKALVRGCFTTSSFALAMGAIQFSIFGHLRQTWNWPAPIAAACGAATSCLVSVPQEVIKQRLVTGVYTSFRTAVSSIAKEDGIRGFYSAWRPTMLRNVPFVMITFTTQDLIKQQILSSRLHQDSSTSPSSLKERRKKQQQPQQQPKELSIIENMVVGMASALVAGIATNPIDVVKTRMMTQASSTAPPYTSAIDCVQQVIQKEGITTFYAGFKQRSIYMCGLWGITFAINGYLNSKKDPPTAINR